MTTGTPDAVDRFDTALTAALDSLDRPIPDLTGAQRQVAALDAAAVAARDSLRADMDYPARLTAMRSENSAAAARLGAILAREQRVARQLWLRLAGRRVLAILIVLVKVLVPLGAILLIFAYRVQILDWVVGLLGLAADEGPQ